MACWMSGKDLNKAMLFVDYFVREQGLEFFSTRDQEETKLYFAMSLDD